MISALSKLKSEPGSKIRPKSYHFAGNQSTGKDKHAQKGLDQRVSRVPGELHATHIPGFSKSELMWFWKLPIQLEVLRNIKAWVRSFD
jgi:hypothetical protein